MIVDDTEVPRKKRIKCKFKGCITILNDINIEDQIFCSLHQSRVCEIMATSFPNGDFRYYGRLIKNAKKRKKYSYGLM